MFKTDPVIMFKIKHILLFLASSIVVILTSLILVVSFMGCAATSKHESTGQYIDNSVITSKVKTAIFEEPTLKTMQITVESYKGEVQLSGFVDSVVSLRKAGDIARGVEGVTGVKNDLVVK